MPFETKLAISRRALAEDVFPFLETIDMDSTIDKLDGIPPKMGIIEKNGKFYDILITYMTRLVEVRIDVYDYDPSKGRHGPGVREKIYAHLTKLVPAWNAQYYTGGIFIGKYRISYYERHREPKNECFYCKSRHTGGFKAHDRCAKHNKNKAVVITDLAKAARINEDCMRHIMSYLY